MCKYKRNFLKCCAPGFARNFRSSKILGKIYGTDDTNDSANLCRHFSKMLRTVASPGTFGCHDLGRLGKYELVPKIKKNPFFRVYKKSTKEVQKLHFIFGVSHTIFAAFMFHFAFFSFASLW